MSPSNRSTIGIGIAFLVAASLSAGFARFGNGVALVWIANALLMAYLQRRAPKTWIAPMLVCAAASFVATSLFGLGLRVALPLAIANVGEAALGALLFSRQRKPFVALRSSGEILSLGIVALTVPAVSGVLGAASAHIATGVAFWPNWAGWCAAHALGILITTPLTALILDGEIVGWARVSSRRSFVEAGALMLGTAATAMGVFAQGRFPLLFLPFLPLMICVFRLGRLGATASLVLLTIIGCGFTIRGAGPIPLIDGNVIVHALFLQLYLATAVLIALPAAAELKRRNQIFSRLQESTALYQIIADRTGDVILATALDGVVRYVSPSIVKMYGLRQDEVVGKRARELIMKEDHPHAIAAHLNALRNPEETYMAEYRGRGASGEIGWFETHIRAIVDSDGTTTGAVSIIREISDRKDKELRLTAAAATDALTAIGNRRSFEAAFEELRAGSDAAPIGCIALFDLDHFKRVNDENGHNAGDQVLKTFAAILKDGVRERDVVARLGGEEFGAILIGADAAQGEAVCNRIRMSLMRTRTLIGSGSTLGITVSVGLAILWPDRTLATSMEAADAALYRAKSEGRNRLSVSAS